MKLSKRVRIDRILIPGDRLLAPRTERVHSMADSIGQTGLISPITIRPHEMLPGKYWLVAGLTRLRAFQKQKRTSIAALVETIDARTARQMEIDENLERTTLTEAERILLTAERLELLKESRNSQKPAPEKSKAYSKKRRQRGHSNGRAVALATGIPLRTVQRRIAREVALGEATIERIKRTSLDSGAEMDALITLTRHVPEQANTLIERAAAGEAVSAIAIVQTLKRAPAPTVADFINVWRNKITRLWDRADMKTREEFATFVMDQATTTAGSTSNVGDPHHVGRA